MSAVAKLGKVREGQGMNIQDENTNQGDLPKAPDEGWWSAVLADEVLVESENTGIEAESVEKPSSTESDFSCASINWDKVLRIFLKDEILSLSVVGFNRGGVLVASDEIHGFVPASHLIDLPPDLAEDDREQYLTSYLDRKISLKVIECNPDKERIVFSERAALAGEGQRKFLLMNLKEGDVIHGVVTNVTSFGAFVDLGGLEGLIHVSELSWGRVTHPSEVVKVDDEVDTLVLQVLEDEGRIALSLKRLEDNPWEMLAEKLDPGSIVTAEISSIVKFGAFARLEEGIEGLIHISSMNFPSGCSRIDDFLFEGQPIEVCILNIDPKNRRLGLKLERLLSE